MILGILSDTHVPDRRRELSPQVIDFFKQEKVEAILHAGDISTPRVLTELAQIAPVYAVRGNRDWVRLGHLPLTRYLTFNGVPIALAHGHGGWQSYLVDRAAYMIQGYRLERFTRRLLKAFPQARVIVFGHTHRPLNRWVDGQLLFNPGSAHIPSDDGLPASIGLLHLENGQVWGEIIHP